MKYLIFITIAVFAMKTSFSQIQYEDEKKKVTIISYEERDLKKVSKSDQKNAVKLGIADVLMGHQSIYYEREFNKVFSAQVGIGLSHRNFYEDLGAMINMRNRYYGYDFSDADFSELHMYKEVRKAGIGYAISFNPRVYTNGWGMEGFYVGPSIRYQQNNTKYTKDGLNEKEYLKKFSIGLVIGGQSNNKPVCVDYGIGIGFKSMKLQKYLNSVYDNDYQPLPSGLYDLRSKGVNFEVYLNIGGFFSFKKEK